MTDTELIAGYLDHLRWCNRAQTTIDIRRTYLEKLSHELGPFDKIKPKRLRKWLADPGRHLEASSQAVLLSAFHSFYHWATTERLLKKDPTLRIEKPATPKGEPHPIVDADREKALANADALMRCWLLLGSLAGLRCQEIALMSREDVREDTATLFVAHGKGRKQRFVPLAPTLLDALNDWGMPSAGRLWDMTPAQMSKAINAYLHSLGAKSVDGEPATAHSLRHWFGSKTYQASKDLRLTQILMGHSSPTTTAGYAAADMTQAAGIVGSL
jgi:integrase/recombinase XerC